MIFKPRIYDPAKPWRLPDDTTDVTITTADGIRLNGWFLSGAAPRTGVTVLYLHGNASTLADVARDATFLQAKGFDVFAIDYRGYGKSEGVSTGERTLQLDGRAALDHLVKDRGIDRSTIAFFGQSLGTTVAADLAVTSACRATVLMAPLASASAQASDVLPSVPSFLHLWMTSPLDTVRKIGRAQCPVLVVHGDKDGTISVAQGRAVHDAAKPPKKLIVVPNGRHYLPLTTGADYVADVVGFLATPPSP